MNQYEYDGPQWSTLLNDKLLAANIPITGVGKTEKGDILVHYSAEATDDDRNKAAVIVASFNEDLEIAKVKQLEKLRLEFEAAGAAGYDTGLGFKLRASTEDQTEFNKLQTSIAMFTQAGFWNDATPITILDTDLLPHTVSISQWQAIGLGYVGFCLQLVNAMGLARAAILTAETVPQAQAVSLTGG